MWFDRPSQRSTAVTNCSVVARTRCVRFDQSTRKPTDDDARAAFFPRLADSRVEQVITSHMTRVHTQQQPARKMPPVVWCKKVARLRWGARSINMYYAVRASRKGWRLVVGVRQNRPALADVHVGFPTKNMCAIQSATLYTRDVGGGGLHALQTLHVACFPAHL